MNRMIAIETYRILLMKKYLFSNNILPLVTARKTRLNYILSIAKPLLKGAICEN